MSEAFSLLVLVGACFVAILRLTRWMCPWVADLLEWIWARVVMAAVRTLRRSLSYWTWQLPRQRFGVGMTLWGWSVVVAVIASIISLLSAGAAGVPCALAAWVVAGVGWWVLHWLGERRYRPRPLPQRTQARRRR